MQKNIAEQNIAEQEDKSSLEQNIILVYYNIITAISSKQAA